MNPDISVIISFLNEEENLEKLVNELNNYFSTISPLKTEIIFVDDGSTDDSVSILETMGHNSYDATLIKLSKNYGSHSALRAGIMHTKGKFVTFLAADLQDPLELIDKLYKKCIEGFDIVFAFRDKVKSGFIEKFFSKLYARLMKIFVADNFPQNGFDIVMFNQRVRDELNQNVEVNSSLFLQIITLGFKQVSITFNRNPRFAGKSKWTLTNKIKMVIDSFVAFSYAPIRFVSIVGILLSILGFGWMSYIILRAILFQNFVSGWPSLIAILMIGFGITNISLGIIAEYLWRTLAVSRKRKVFIINEIVALNKNHL